MSGVRLVLRDSQWERIAPHLLGKLGDPGRSGANNRLFVEAVLWLARTGSPWRDLPDIFGNWNSVFVRFSRWSKDGVWERLFAAMADDPDFEYIMIDSTIVRAHQHAAGKTYGPPRRQVDYFSWLNNLRKRIRPFRQGGWPRWRSARPDPHKRAGVDAPFLPKDYRTPVDCQAIFLSPPADIVGRQRFRAGQFSFRAPVESPHKRVRASTGPRRCAPSWRQARRPRHCHAFGIAVHAARSPIGYCSF